MRLTGSPRRTAALDVGFYLISAAFAGATAVFSEFYGYRIWGALAVVAYLVGLIQALIMLSGPAAGFAVRPGVADRRASAWSRRWWCC